ncbi:hypothetical protein QVD17_25329 [Tagetes erecta]|uniref:Calmodulin-binding domain-containing protein n=1 Tax=Tagetes erecta TaxID=13708 RepID=A0AAD8KL27_TARER|nr:hypothetical protein QVD17_25329 [Tagetes erecta]
MNRTRKGSPRTFKMETTGPKVPSRYLTGPTGSCHDVCKCATKQTTETKPINPLPKRIPKPPANGPNSVPRISKSPAVIPKTTTRNIKNNNVVKDPILKKDVAVEPKKQDFKLKSGNSHVKTYNRSSSKTPRRRLSDNFVPNKDMSIQSSRLPKRRLSEIIIHQKTDMASVSNGSTGRGSGNNKNESRKDSKLPLVNKKSSSVKTTVSTTKRNAKVSPLRTNRSLPKPEIKGSSKSKPAKPIEEFVHEETLHVIEPNNDVDITISQSESQSQNSLDCSPSSSKAKAIKDDQNEAVEHLSPSMEDDTLAKDYQNDVLQSSPPSIEDDTLEKDDQNEVAETSPPSIEDDTLAKDDQNEAVETSPPSLEDDTLVKDDQNVLASSPTLIEHDQNEVVETTQPSIEDDTLAKDDQNEMVESLPPSMEDDTIAKDDQDQQNNNVSDFGKLAVETNDSNDQDLRFIRGTILSPESENNSLVEMQFIKGKELENETEIGEHISLRRLSSDGVVYIPESVTISVDLKHQETEEKKAAVLINNVIEETASKLIQTRKSKVKALVGAFETIVSSDTP